MSGQRQGTGQVDSGLSWSPDAGSVQPANVARNPPLPHTHTTRAHGQATFSPVRPDGGASRPPLPPVPLGLPPGRRLSRWGPAAALPLRLPASAPPGGGAAAEGAGPAGSRLRREAPGAGTPGLAVVNPARSPKACPAPASGRASNCHTDSLGPFPPLRNENKCSHPPDQPRELEEWCPAPSWHTAGAQGLR